MTQEWQGPYMDIESPPGTVVVYHDTSDDQVRFGNCTDPRKAGLVIGQDYIVEYAHIHSWHTKVHLVGYSGGFPSNAFHNKD